MFGISKVPSFFNITLLNKNVGFSGTILISLNNYIYSFCKLLLVYSVLARPSSAYYKNDLSQVYVKIINYYIIL
jgi:hypothetical protein